MKKSIAAILAGALCLSALTACGGSTSSSDSSAAANTGDSDKVITVGATPTPHAEILNAAKDALEAEGYTLKVVEFTDYVQPNTALVDGDLDANYFQHNPVPQQLQQGERHRSGRSVRYALRAVRHLRRQNRIHRGACGRRFRRHPERRLQRDPRAAPASGRRPHQAEGRHRPDLRTRPSSDNHQRTRRTSTIQEIGRRTQLPRSLADVRPRSHHNGN